MIIGGLPGVVIGAALWRVAPDDVFRVLIGVVSLGFVIWQVVGRRLLSNLLGRAMPDWGGYAAGTVSGFASFVSHAGGPPVAM